MRLKIATKLKWPSFVNVAVGIQRALKNRCHCSIHDWSTVRTGGDILLVGTVSRESINFLPKLLPGSNIVFYGTTEGHSLIDKSGKRLAKQTRIVAVSHFVGRMLNEIGLTVTGVVHHGIDMNDQRMDRPFYRRLRERFENRDVILTVAGNHPRKGLEKLLRAHKRVEEEMPDSFLILHTESTCGNLIEIARNLGIRNLWITRLYGRLGATKLNALYNLCRVYVQPSFAEGFGLPILEAYRFDKPVVAVDAPPLNEIVKNDKTGVLIPYREIRWHNFKNRVLFKMHMYRAGDLSDAMMKLLSDDALRHKMEVRIRKEKKRWSMYELYPKLLTYFE